MYKKIIFLIGLVIVAIAVFFVVVNLGTEKYYVEQIVTETKNVKLSMNGKPIDVVSVDVLVKKEPADSSNEIAENKDIRVWVD